MKKSEKLEELEKYYLPPPWEVKEETTSKTEGWCAFQDYLSNGNPLHSQLLWVPYDLQPPVMDTVCYVTNANYSSNCFIALYQANYKVFVLYDPKMHNHPCLDVTHWVGLPSPLL